MLSANILIALLLSPQFTSEYLVWRNYNPKGPKHQNYAIGCLHEMIRDFFPIEDHPVLFSLISNDLTSPAFEIQNRLVKDLNLLSRWGVELIGDDEMTFESSEVCINCPTSGTEMFKRNFIVEYKARTVVLVVDSLESFMERFNYLVEHKRFEPRARILVYFSEVSWDYRKKVKEIFKVLWSRLVYETIVVVPKNNLIQWNVYFLDIFTKSETCGGNPTVRRLQLCSRGKIVGKRGPYQWPKPQKLGNCSISAVTVKYPPYIIDEENGFEIDILHVLEEKMQVRINVTVDGSGTDWGVKTGKFWTGRLGAIQNSSALGIGSLPIDVEMAKNFDFSASYFYERLVWVIPRAQMAPKWLCIVVIFTFNLWVVCLCTFIAGSFFLYISSTKTNVEKRAFKTLPSCFSISLQVFLGSSSPSQPKTLITRIIFISLALYNIIVASFYQSSLIYYLTNTIYTYQVQTTADVIHYNMRVGGTERIKVMFNQSEDAIYEHFETATGENRTAYDWLKTVGENLNFCTVLGEFYAKYLIAKQDPAVVEGGMPKVFVSKQKLRVQPVQIIMSNGFPLQGRIDQVIGRIIAAGLVNKWTLKYLEELKKISYTQEMNDTVLTLHHIQGAFALLIFGHILGCFVFVLEIVIKLLRKNK